MTRRFRSVLVATVCTAILSACAAKPSAPDYKPSLGQAGKDVIWLPTSQTLVDRMLDMAKVTPSDYLVDLGSGDGRTVITAAKRGVRAHGIEFNSDMVALSQRNAKASGVGNRATFERADIFESDFSQATVVTLFLLPHLNVRLRPTLLKMKPGTRVVSNSFNMAEWQPDETAQVKEGCSSYCNAYKWIVPAQVAGTWKLGDGELTLTQTFQMLEGTLRAGAGTDTVPIKEARMDGAQITFTAGDARYVGRVEGDRMTGTTAGRSSWRAERVRQ